MPPPLSAENLERAALRYLERFAASAASLRRVLMSRVLRAERLHGTDRNEGTVLVEALIGRYLSSGLLNDDAYAEAKAASLRRRGASARAIRDHLAARGIVAETARAALGRIDLDAGAADGGDAGAALALARRRRLGPFRPSEQRAEHRARDLAALGRAGFDFETARRIVDGDREGEES